MMEEFLKQLELSEKAIAIYLNSLGKAPMTKMELLLFSPELSLEDGNNMLEQLTELGLLVKLESQSPSISDYYISIPPFSPILSYYSNINANLEQIHNSVKELIENALNDIFSDNSNLELEGVLNQYLEIKKDIEEDSLIQKQDIKDLTKEMKKTEQVKQIFEDLQQKLKAITQTQFASLIKILTKIKTTILKRIELLKMKKGKEEVIEIVEEVFREKLQQMVDDFTSSLYELIEEEFSKLDEPIQKVNEEMVSIADEFKSLYLNTIEGFEEKMGSLENLLQENNKHLQKNIDALRSTILETMNTISENALNQISSLNQPIINLIEQTHERIIGPNLPSIENIWYITNKVKLNEEIYTILSNSKQGALFLLPKLEGYLPKEQLENISKELKVRIISSDPFTNSTVKAIQESENVQFKKLQNNNIIALKGDNNHVVIAIVKKEEGSPLKNVVGFASSFPPLVGLLTPIIETTWASAQMQVGAAPSAPPPQPQPRQEPRPSPSVRPSITPTVRPSQIAQEQKQAPQPQPAQKITPSPEVKPQPELQAKPKTQVAPSQEIPSSETTQMETPSDSSGQSSLNDPINAEIDKAFNFFLGKVDALKGVELAKILEKVADTILEKKGFSVTLHSVRREINELKNTDTLLDETAKHNLTESVENWKQRFFK